MRVRANPKSNIRNAKRGVRRGATIVEAAVVLLVFLTLVIGMLDLGIAVFRYHTVSQVARHGARQAIVHGSLAPPASGTWTGPWGPTTIDARASDSGVPIVDELRPILEASRCDLDQTRIRAEWLDGGNVAPGQRVRVTVSYPYQPVLTYIFGIRIIDLRATSTMPIAH